MLVERLDAIEPRKLRRLAGLAVFAVLLGVLSKGHFAGAGDAVHYMMIARSLAFDRDLDLANDYDDPHNAIFNGTLRPGAHVRQGAGGILRPVHDVGLPLIAAPAFAAAYVGADLAPRLPEWLRRRARLDRWIALRQLVGIMMAVATAFLSAAFFDLALTVTGRPGAAFVWSVLWAVSVPVLGLSFAFMTEVPSALIALTVYRRVDRLPPGGGSGVSSDPAWPTALGALSGLLLLVHARNVAISLVLLALIVRRTWPSRGPSAGAVAGFLALAAARCALNHHLWGTWLTNPHAAMGAWPGLGPFLAEAARRAGGLWLDQEHGLLPGAPVYALAPAGLWLLWRAAPGRASEMGALTLAYFLSILAPTINVHGWRGGFSTPARFLVPIAPFLGVFVLTAMLAPRARVLGPLLGLAQVAFAVVFWQRPMLMWANGTGRAAFAEALGGEWLVRTLPSWERAGGMDNVVVAVAVAAWIAATLYVARAPRADAR